MTEQTKKIVLPAYLVRRLEAFRIVKGEATSYLLRDKLHEKTHDFDAWQFFILEVLPGCETFEKLQSVFKDRFDRDLSTADANELFAYLADGKLLDESALQHPLLKSYARKTYEVVEGKAVVKALGGAPVAELPPAAKAHTAAPPAGPRPEDKELPGGVEDVAGLDPKSGHRMLPLFDPRPILRVLVPVVAPLRYLMYLLPVMFIVAITLVVKYWPVLQDDLHIMHRQTNIFEHLVFSMLTLNLSATVMMACVAHSFKASVERVCLTLYIGFIPRFVNRIVGAERMTRNQTMWLHGANLMFRLFIFCCAVMVWYSTRNQRGSLHEFALALVLTCAGSLMVETGNPLMKGSSYFLLSAFLNEPHLRGKAHKAMLTKMRAGVYQSSDGTILAIYALASITYAFVLVTFVTLGLGQFLTGHLQIGGSAIIVTIALLAFLFWRNVVSLTKFNDAYERTMQFDRWKRRTLLDKGQAEGEVVTVKRKNYWARALPLCLLLALFLPYTYEAGGSFSIFPLRKQVMSTDTPGLVEEVYFDGGESVKQGTVIARLAHDDYNAQVKIYDAKIAEQKSIIADLKSRPKPEQIQVASEAVQVARTRESFSRDKAPRLEKLYKVGAVTFDEWDTARKDFETDVRQTAEKVAALALAKTGPTPDEIAAAEAKLASLQQERQAYSDKLDRTVLRMPFDGNILTLHLKDRINSYLDKGQPFASFENTGTVTAELQVVESDVQYVAIGSPVRIRPTSFFDREFVGKVSLIDRNVTVLPYGNVVKVLATFDNQDGALKTGMTGEGKVEGPTMPLWQAFSQGIVRFVRVQAWSWIP